MPGAIGLDLGGTNLRGALVNHKGVILARRHGPAEASKGREHVVGSILSLIDELKHEAERQSLTVMGVGAGIPGIIEKGVVYQSPHFPDWLEFNIHKAIAKRVPFPVKIDNDANFVAAGEAWLGAAQGIKNFVCLTLGTGIGGCFYINGRPWYGESGFAGEVGHMVLEVYGPTCSCGARGCWEMYCSATGLKRLIAISEDEKGREEFEKWLGTDLANVTVDKLYEAAREGDIFASTMFKKFGYYFGVGIASLANILDVETYVIGGGISQAWDFFVEDTYRSLKKRTYQETAKRVKLIQAGLGDDAGVIGAAGAFLSL